MHKEAPDITPHKVTPFYWLLEALWGLWEQADILQDEKEKKENHTAWHTSGHHKCSIHLNASSCVVYYLFNTGYESYMKGGSSK